MEKENLINDPKRTITWFSGTMMCVGMSIGAGIFSLPALILGDVGSPGMVLICFVMGSLVAAFGAWAYSELGTMRPVSGGEKEYLAYAFPNTRGLFAFMFTQARVFLVGPGCSSALNVAFGEYCLYALFGSKSFIMENSADYPFLSQYFEWVCRGIGVIAILFQTMVHGFAPRIGVKIQDALSMMKILLLCLVLIIGITASTGLTSMQRASNFVSPFEGTKSDPNALSGAFLKALFTYDGWNNLNYSLDELIDPVRTLPRATFSAVGITAILYIAAVTSYFLVIPSEDIDPKSAILAGTFFKITMGEVMGQRIIPFFIGLSAFGSSMCTTFGVSRVTESAAREGYFPFSSKVSYKTKDGAPLGGLVLHLIMTLILMLAPPPGEAFNFLINLACYPEWIFYGLTVFGLLYMRFTRPDAKRPIRSPWVTNIVFLLVSFFIVVIPFVPPAVYESSIPYYLHALIGFGFCIFCVPWWYIQVVLLSKPDKDYILSDDIDKYEDGIHSYYSPTLITTDD
jgi:amino acid transporter